MIFSLFKSDDGQLIKRGCSYLKKYKLRFTISVLCIISGIGFSLAFPLIWAKVISALFSKEYSQVTYLILVLLVINLLQSVQSFFQSYLLSYLNENIIYDIKCDMYNKLLYLPIRLFDKKNTGEYISRIHGDASSVANIITNEFLNTIVEVLRAIILIIVLFFINFYLALIVLFTFPIFLAIFGTFGKKLRARSQELAKLNDLYFGNMQQTISGIREIKGFAAIKIRFNSYINLINEMKQKNIGIGIIQAFSRTSVIGMNYLSELIILASGSYLLYSNKISIEYFIAFCSYSNQFNQSSMVVTRLNSSVQQVMISLKRIFELMDNFNYPVESFGNKVLSQNSNKISFENVSFSYKSDVPVLNNISFIIPANKKTAIVGASGSGKTTIFNLIMRFYSNYSGNISIDGIDLMEIKEESLRQHISIVRQDPFLFNISIKENLRIANPSSTDEELINACKTANINDFIIGLPKGYDTIIGDNSINISGGQRQRLAIARTILKNPKIILFDEATSSLDNESQLCIKNSIDEMSKNRTVITIAHRLLTIIEADNIIVLDKGEVIGQGTHFELMQNNEIYKRFFKTELDVLNNSNLKKNVGT